MLVKTTKNVSVKNLKGLPYNPPNRVAEKNLKDLEKSISEIGQLYPILISESNDIIDGHRRVAVAKILGKGTVPAIVLQNNGTATDTIYGSVNATAKKLNGNDNLGIWLRNPNAVIHRHRMFFENCESLVGRRLMEKLYKHGHSAKLVSYASLICSYCEIDREENIAKVLEWTIDHRNAVHCMATIRLAISPTVLLRAIKKNKPLSMSYSNGNGKH